MQSHKNILCLVSGGSDSDVMMDLLLKCGGKDKTHFAFVDTGLEYAATKEHIKSLSKKYEVEIETIKPKKSIPACVKEYGVPFWSKFASDMLERLQRHSFKFEDESFDVLYKRYPKCKTALEWWCNISEGTQLFTINRYPLLKEFIMSNPPTFKISMKCCEYAKKQASRGVQIKGDYDMICIGVRKFEGGIRAAHNTCFDSKSESGGIDMYRPVFWFSDKDKEIYCKHYNINHSDCYEKYGLVRTGCFGCPFGKRFEEELKQIEQFEPRLLSSANSIFKDSYNYTREFLKFREEMRKCK